MLSVCVFKSCCLPASPAVRIYSCFLPYRDSPSLTTLKYGILSGFEPLHVDCISVEIHGIKTFPSLCLPRLCTMIVFLAHQLLENPILHLEIMIFCAGFCTDSLQIMKHWSDWMKLILAPFPLRVSIIYFFHQILVGNSVWFCCLLTFLSLAAAVSYFFACLFAVHEMLLQKSLQKQDPSCVCVHVCLCVITQKKTFRPLGPPKFSFLSLSLSSPTASVLLLVILFINSNFTDF